ncbi:hypothetical protein LTR02_009198 [Friedmanniomyces endolithicus]|nr:hypothetical protein LTR59_009139 [Friedmanniomyces endolithicus]KAK0795279.1 hypothetical protein LTR38_008983 [Friedmanniomyces endolithicus]KAK0847107.1 hypothetical protein LTR03_006453 [Friedmanniomyces endolithicus]KAK0883119.1 hypothetical protein LTR87_003112 [Friedmanniomyces endolithicus]KAK0900432.1 hypothetical protein LTR02_009198 [Friedmanniomyces endolithicus]
MLSKGTASTVSGTGGSPAVITSGLADGTRIATSPSAAEMTLPQDTADVEESLFDSAAFLSFEEWKKQDLARTGQSPENLGHERPQSGNRQRPGLNNALDTLGEDSEIDLDFAGFGNAAAAASSRGDNSPEASSSAKGIPDASGSGQSATATARLRSRDAGTTCKARTNYASFDCAATMMKQNAECKHASSILVENKDSYMLNKCSASNKFFIVELCNDIHIDTIVLANYEFFSSSFRHFRVSVTDRYPVKADKWKDLGTFEARNTREVQAFLVDEPQIWARYVRIEMLTHYGSEYYCPVSLLRVHGRTMMQEFRQEEEMARGELSDELASLEIELPPPVQGQEPLTATDELEKATVQALPPIVTSTNTKAAFAAAGSSANATSSTSTDLNVADPNLTATGAASPLGPILDAMTCAPSHMPSSSSVHSTFNESMIMEVAAHKSKTIIRNIDNAATFSASHSPSPASSSPSHSAPSLENSPALSAPSSTITTSSETASEVPRTATEIASKITASDRNSTSSTKASLLGNASGIAANTTRSSPMSSLAPPSSSQESFFKSISKRLQQLESNSTLSLQYIEEQSRILRDAFNKVEKRQIAATTTFLSQLNRTVMNELQGFQQAYDQLWQGTVIELDGQRDRYQREMLALSSRLTLVADELVWQKRMGIVQSTLLLVCLSLVLFTRQGNTGYVETTLAQQLMSRSQAALRAGWESDPNSPSSPASRSPVSIFRRKLWKSNNDALNGTLSEDGDTRPQTRDGAAPSTRIELPTPDEQDEEDEEGGLEEARDGPLRTQSSPPAPERGVQRPPSSGGGSRNSSPGRDDA